MQSKISIIFIGLLCLFQKTRAQICVLPGTCSTGTVTVPNQIDIRIVTPTVPPTTAPITCPPGLVLCAGSIVVQCGVRYFAATADDGNATPGAHPWQAYIVNQTSFTGSGLILDQYHILTAAHKVAANVATPTNIRVFLGVWDPASAALSQNRTAVRIVIHPNYNPINLFNNIAIIRVDNPITLGQQPTVNTGCLPTQGASYVGQNCVVAGWGQSQFTVPDSPVRPMRQVTVPVVNYPTCRASMAQGSLLGPNVDVFLDPVGNICAGGSASRDACTNDGGSPLMCPDPTTGRWTVAGLVLWGRGCGQAGVFGVYTNVPNYRTWIDTTIATLNAGGVPDLRGTRPS